MNGADEAAPSKHSQRGLDWLNFFIADVQTGFGPFTAVYLAAQGWSQGDIGLLLTIGGIAGIASQIPGGALVDAVRTKRLIIAVALGVIALGALTFAFFTNTALLFIAETLHGSTSGLIKPALAAIGLGLVGHRAFSGRLGRNHRYDAFGNAATAALMGLIGYLASKQAVFLIAAALCVPAAYALTMIRGDDIDYARARSSRDRQKPRDVAQLRELMKNRHLVVFVVSLVLFQFANASVMPLASERLAQQQQHESELVTAALVVVPQMVTALIAAWVARRAEDWGRKPLLLAGFAALPLRAVLFALAPGPWYLVAIQVLSGLTAAVIGIMVPLVIADVTRGTGRYNLAQGVAGTAAGIGAALSTVIAGYVAQSFGYAIGFGGLAAIGAAGLSTLYWLLPETRPPNDHAGSGGFNAMA
ncbi:MAG TPA: MFS transporter [Stellaceae bacterium]|nr:MFS transporter [Stellaceae bacterium]